MGHRLYHDCLQLRDQNFHLLQKEKELKALRETMKRIQEDENIIRSFLGLDSRQRDSGALGQGGEPSPDLSTIAPDDAKTSSGIAFPATSSDASILQRAECLQQGLHELAETIRDQRQSWDSTPSIVPVKTDEYWFSSSFGWRESPFTGQREFHNGLDISSRKDTPVIAPANGVVIKRGYDKYVGKYLQIDHGRKVVTTYGHLSGFNASRGQKVERGEVIGFMGNTGLSTGHHLHYMVRVNSKCVNPVHYILNAKGNQSLLSPLLAEGGE
ncbi:MAG: M23 family metallopeptidase [Syntrophobacteria bacterium]